MYFKGFEDQELRGLRVCRHFNAPVSGFFAKGTFSRIFSYIVVSSL